GGEDDHLRGRDVLLDAIAELQAVALGQVIVEQDQVRLYPPQNGPDVLLLAGALARVDDARFAFEHGLEPCAQGRMVIDDDDAYHDLPTLSGMSSSIRVPVASFEETVSRAPIVAARFSIASRPVAPGRACSGSPRPSSRTETRSSPGGRLNVTATT